MFISSWRAGLVPLAFPHFWILTAVLLTAYGFYFLLIRWATSPGESAGAAAPGCLVQVVGILFQGLAAGTFVVLAMPLLLSGAESRISWDLAQPLLLLGWRAGVLAALVISIFTLLPPLGRALGGNPGVELFLILAASLRFSAPLFLETRGRVSHFPNVWESLGYLAGAWILCKLLQIGFHFSSKLFPNSGRSRMISSILGPTVDLFGGILAFLAYAAYVKLSP